MLIRFPVLEYLYPLPVSFWTDDFSSILTFNIVSVIKTWYEFIGNNRSEYELDELANVLGTFFNLRYAKEHKKYENLFVILSFALLENNTDHPIDIICSKLKKDVNSLDETDTMMLLRIIDM